MDDKDWIAALPFLAKASDKPVVVAAATKDQAVNSPKSALECGQSWIAAAGEIEGSDLESVFLQRALARLRQAKKGITGLSRVIAQKEIDRLTKQGVQDIPLVAKTAAKKMEPGPISGPITGARLLMDNVVDVRWAQFDTIDVLKRIDVEKDQIYRVWNKNNGVLHSGDLSLSRLRLPVVFPEQYDLLIDCKPISGNGNMVLRLTTPAGESFLVQLNGHRPDYKTSGLEHINGQEATQNSTRYETKLFQKGQLSRVAVSVRRNRISVSVDGKTVIDYTGPQDVFVGDKGGNWLDKHRLAPVLGTYKSEFEFHSIVVKQFRDALSDKIFPSKAQVASGAGHVGFRRGDASLTSRIASARKIYLDEIPEAAFAVGRGAGTLGRQGMKGHAKGARVWINKQPLEHALNMHPTDDCGCYVQYHLDGAFKTLSIQPGISELKPNNKKKLARGKLRFAVYADGKLLKNIDNVRSAGIAADWKLDIDGARTLMLVIQCQGSSYGAHAIWANPLLEK